MHCKGVLATQTVYRIIMCHQFAKDLQLFFKSWHLPTASQKELDRLLISTLLEQHAGE